jgi:hypothetical protein
MRGISTMMKSLDRENITGSMVESMSDLGVKIKCKVTD